ncbi:PsiF family protein [Ottowia thiooxydans]|uniref:PsiF repeat protein n=1 Tax=Ottowia thiooxydans TaxID=219182 RepID=A0ABV2QBT7_9BURK
MRKFLILAALATAFTGPAFANNKQQEVMKSCNTAATGKKGDERKDFMKACLSDGRKAQQEKMKTCNADATGKKGDERKAFMSQCLSKG